MKSFKEFQMNGTMNSNAISPSGNDRPIGLNQASNQKIVTNVDFTQDQLNELLSLKSAMKTPIITFLKTLKTQSFSNSQAAIFIELLILAVSAYTNISDTGENRVFRSLLGKKDAN